MPTINYSVSLTGAGSSIAQAVPRVQDGADAREITLPVAQSGTLTTRTNATAGILTMANANHGIVNATAIDVFFPGGKRYGATVQNVAGNAVTFNAGAGDNLANANTVMTAATQVLINLGITGSLLKILGIMPASSDTSRTQQAHADFQDINSVSVNAIALTHNVPQVFDVAGGAANPLTGNAVERVKAANGDPTNQATLTIIVGQDSTP